MAGLQNREVVASARWRTGFRRRSWLIVCVLLGPHSFLCVENQRRFKLVAGSGKSKHFTVEFRSGLLSGHEDNLATPGCNSSDAETGCFLRWGRCSQLTPSPGPLDSLKFPACPSPPTGFCVLAARTSTLVPRAQNLLCLHDQL